MSDLSNILIVLVLGGALSWLSQRYKFANAVAQVVLGVVLGTAVLGWVPHSPLLHTLGEIGVVLMLGIAGLEVGISRLRAAGRAGAAVAILGIAFSVVGGYAIGHLYGSPSDEALYLGLALGATSIGITVQVLEQFGLIGHRVANIIIAAAVIDDIIVLYLLGATHGFISDGLNTSAILGFVVLAIGVLGGLFVICRGATRWASRYRFIDRRWWRGAWIVTLVSLGAWLTHSLGLSSVVGAFFAGLGAGDGLTGNVSNRSARELRPLALILMPFFFIMIGVQAQLHILNDSAMRWSIVGLIAFAVLSKAIGGMLGALRVGNTRERLLIGLGMVPRGEVALIIATLGFEQGHLSQPVFVMLILTTIAVAVLGPLMMAPLAKRLASEQSLGAAS